MQQTTTYQTQALANALFHDVHLLKQTNPIVHNVTNLVVMQTTANVLLAVGASPIMAHAQEELAEIVGLANALVINIGTLDEKWVESIAYAQHVALQRNIPIILDPVGAGATHYRTQVAKKILQAGTCMVRGNASEIMALADDTVQTRGVDAQHKSNDALAAAQLLADKYHCTVVVSGAIDHIVDATREVLVKHGTPLFTKVTGMGCSATALLGAFSAINTDYLQAATHAMAFFSIAGEIAEQRSQGPGTFYTALLDVLHTFQPHYLDRLNITQQART